jgi:hypothetical protein
MTNLESILSMRFFSIPLPIIPIPMKPIGDIIFISDDDDVDEN